MHSILGTGLLPLLVYCFLAAPIYTDCQEAKQDFKKYKFLYFAFEKDGSHGMQISQSGKVLARQGHNVSFLLGSDGPRMPKMSDADLFSFIIFRSQYTAEDRREVFRELSRFTLTGQLGTFWGIAGLIYRAIVTGKPLVVHMIVEECDALLGDKTTMDKLRHEKFDMLVADDFSLCNAILAEALDIPFIQCANWGTMPEKHGRLFRTPIDPTYVPGRLLGFTDRMTLSQRITNYISHWTSVFVHADFTTKYQQLKVKYNIKPDIDIVQSIQQARLWFFNTNYPLEFPRPMHPNTVMVTPMFGAKRKNESLPDDVAKFLNTAPAGVVLFSFGSHVEWMEDKQAQMFADGFAKLPQRVMWQASVDLSRITIGKNTKIVKWIPLAKVMMHKNVKVLVTHGGVNCVFEAIWAGLPIVGIPLLFDTFDNVDRVVARGFGVSLNDVTKVTSESLSNAISTVVNDPKYRENAQRMSAIAKDLTAGTPPAETMAHWILHVTKFGGDHLRPAVYDLNFIERNLIDVYLILSLIVAVIVGGNVSFYYFCCMKRTTRRPKQD